MARKRAGRDIHGVILLDKPAGVTSNRALQAVRRLLGARKAGHTGSLDPFATGMLPICLGEASKTAAFILDADKTYAATARLGEATDTGDLEGTVGERCPIPEVDAGGIERVLARFRGPILQVPPMHSALKHHGQPLYRLARKGIEVERAPRQVLIHELRLVEWAPPLLRFEVTCSRGTYIRTLAEDIARALGSCGHLVALRRLAVATFRGRTMVTPEALQAVVAEDRLASVLLPPDAGLAGWPVVALAGASARRFRQGLAVPADVAPGQVRVHGSDGRVLGFGEVRSDGSLSPRRVFVYEGDTGAGNA